MSTSITNANVNGHFGAISTFHFASNQAGFGGVEGDYAIDKVTSLSVLTGSIKVVDTNEIFTAGQELQVPLVELCLVEAIEPNTQIFQTVKTVQT